MTNRHHESIEEEGETDPYDPILRAMEPGLLISINEGSPNSMPFGEMEVVSSRSDITKVTLEGWDGNHYLVKRKRGDIYVSEVDVDGMKRGHEVETIEVLGIDE